MTVMKWVLALIVGGFLIMFGVMKFTGGAHIFQYIEFKASIAGVPFADLAYPLGNYATGLLEIASGALLILPMTRQLGTKLAILPFLGAVAFHLSPLLGVTTPDGFSDPAPAAALAAGGPFTRTDFSAGESNVLFMMAAGMLVVAIINFVVQRRD